ncbi:MAG: class I SAM-dependent methyltransferase [Actinomycetota bacterium]|nr:class I SAM-dependent methyltransferase [Actinomycetota bacterium]
MTGQRQIPKFHRISRTANRRAHARHPYAHHIRRLPVALRSLVPRLELAAGSRVLDYGCAERPYRDFFGPTVEYVGADLEGNPDADLILRADGSVPAPEQSFDAVISTQVLEHVQDPALYLAECFRLLRPGGRLLLSTHGVFPYHPDPVDLWRWTCAGLRLAVQDAGLQVVEFEGLIGMAASGLQLVQDAVSYRIRPRWVPWLALMMQPLVAFADRFETPETLGYNAQVFALVAQRPR